jgi:hypothetical protein
MSCQGIRQLLSKSVNSTVSVALVDSGIILLKSTHLQVQYEGYELLQELMKIANLQDQIIHSLISVTRQSIEENAESTDFQKYNRNQPDRLGQWGMPLEAQKEKERMISASIQQAYACKLLG